MALPYDHERPTRNHVLPVDTLVDNNLCLNRLDRDLGLLEEEVSGLTKKNKTGAKVKTRFVKRMAGEQGRLMAKNALVVVVMPISREERPVGGAPFASKTWLDSVRGLFVFSLVVLFLWLHLTSLLYLGRLDGR